MSKIICCVSLKYFKVIPSHVSIKVECRSQCMTEEPVLAENYFVS